MTVKTYAQLINEIQVSLPDNVIGQITPSILRSFETDIVDTMFSFPVPQVFPVNLGTLPFVQADNYTGGSGNILSVRGTLLAPITDNKATAVFQSVNNTSTNEGVTVYASLIKQNTATIDHHCIYTECIDLVGGGSVAGGRFTTTLFGGSTGNATGSTNVAVAVSPATGYTYLQGSENQVWNDIADATTTYSGAKFAVGVLSSCAGTKSADAGFLINTNAFTAGHGYITGFFVPTTGGSAGQDCVIDTAFRCDAKVVYGLDLSRGTFSGAPIRIPGGTNPIIATSSSITTGAGAGTGTLTNAPASTNPTKWIPINDNGTVRYIPAW